MGLLDVLNGMQNGPRGSRDPAEAGRTGGGGMSPVLMAVLGLLAYKAVKGFSSGNPDNPAKAGGATSPGMSGVRAGSDEAPSIQPGATGGGLSDLLKGGLGGLFAGGAAGSILSGGLKDLLDQFQQSGQGNKAESWVGTGANKPISPDELGRTLTADQVRVLEQQTGMSREELLAALSEHLPNVVNEMTPNGRLPTEQEVSRFM